LIQNFSEKSRKAFELIQRQMQEQMDQQTNRVLESLRIKPPK